MESEVYRIARNMLLCGVGGQDTVLVPHLIVLTAMEKGVEAREAETIGMAQGGGSVVSHVCIGEEIYSPLILHGGANVLIGFEPTEAARCLPYLKKSGCMVVSPAPTRSVTASLTGGGYTGLEMMEYLEYTADNLAVMDAVSTGMACGSPKVMNVALLGAATTSGLVGVSLGEMEAAIEKRVPEKFKDMNMKALKLDASVGPTIR